MKLEKNYEGISEKLWKHIGDTLHKPKKNHFDRNFLKFSSQFLELTKNCTETLNNFRENLQWNPEEILKIFEALLKICPGSFQSLFWHCTSFVPTTPTATRTKNEKLLKKWHFIYYFKCTQRNYKQQLKWKNHFIH